MTFKVRKSGAFSDAGAVKRMSGGSWTDVSFVKAREAGAWVQVWPLYGVSIDNALVLASGGTTATAVATYRLGADGTVYTKLGTGSFTPIDTWLDVGTNSLYEVRFTQTATSGTGTFTGTLGSWLALTSDRDISLSNVVAASGSATRTIQVEIRVASSGTVLDTANIGLESERV